MPVDDGLAEIKVREEKFISNPEQVVFLLLRQVDAGPCAGMDEEEIAANKRRLETAEKTEMGLRQRLVERRLQPGDPPLARERCRIDAVRHQRANAAKAAQPSIEQTGFAQAFERDKFMIPFEEHGLAGLSIPNQAVDGLA